MLSMDAIWAAIREHAEARPKALETIRLHDVPGRVCAQDIYAPCNIQPFDNAAMDGAAVRRADLADAGEDHPVRLSCHMMVQAGDGKPGTRIEAGHCARIMTGAPVPDGADAVVPVEKIEADGDDMIFTACPDQHANIRFSGEDFAQGDHIFGTGRALGRQHILPLATLGIDCLDVYQRPRIAFISTGRELVDDLAAELKDGEIYNSNRAYAGAFLNQPDIDFFHATTIADEPEEFRKTLEAVSAQEPDIIVSSGAVSAGDYDFVRSELESFGAEIINHKLKLKPGKPNLLARLPSGALYFGLPGNPVASAVGLRFLVTPAIRAMTGQVPETPIPARLDEPLGKKPGLHQFFKARGYCDDQGIYRVRVLDGQESFKTSPFMTLNCWISLPEAVERLEAGDCVETYPLAPSRA